MPMCTLKALAQQSWLLAKRTQAHWENLPALFDRKSTLFAIVSAESCASSMTCPADDDVCTVYGLQFA